MTANHHYVPVARPVSRRTRAEGLHRAVSAARLAPSAHNAQPWRWRLSDDGMDLFAEPARMAGITDPGGRLVAISCGAALHHARLDLAAHGWRVTTVRQPGGTGTGPFARLTIDEVSTIGRSAARAAQAIPTRHTDPRPVTGAPLEPGDLSAIRTAVEAEGSHLHVLGADEILRLAAPASPPDGDREAAEAQWHDELTRWAGPDRIVHGEVLPGHTAGARPGRDVGRAPRLGRRAARLVARG